MKKQHQVNQKLIVITRRDLSPGYQAVQALHAGIDFQHQYPQVSKQWQSMSNYLVLLSVNNERELVILINKFSEHKLNVTIFKEPDIDNEITSIAVEPCELSKKLTSNLPLALKEFNK